MKKILLIAFFLAVPFVQAKEETPILIDNPAIVDIAEENIEAIDVDNMKKSNEIKRAQEEIEKDKNQRKIKLDTRQINHQRALDYTTKRTSPTMLPTF